MIPSIKHQKESINMVIKKILFFTFLMSIVVSTFAEPEKKDFDAMCALIQDAMELGLEPQARLTYINNQFDSRVGSKDVKESYDLVFQVSPNQRYQVFKQAVESSLGPTWECPALNEFFK